MEVVDWAKENVYLGTDVEPIHDLRELADLEKAREKLWKMVSDGGLPVVRSSWEHNPSKLLRVKIGDDEVYEYLDGNHKDFKKDPDKPNVEPKRKFRVLSYRCSENRLRKLADGSTIAAYPTEEWTWIDCYTHLNEPKARLICLGSMGKVFRRNDVFLDYFWGDDAEWTASCRRGWMWQEQSLGLTNWHEKCYDLEKLSEAFRIKIRGTARHQFWLCRFREWRERVHGAAEGKRDTPLQNIADCMASEDVSFMPMSVDPTVLEGYVWAIIQSQDFFHGVWDAYWLQRDWSASERPGDLTGLWPFTALSWRENDGAAPPSGPSPQSVIAALAEKRSRTGLEWVWSLLSSPLQEADALQGGVRHFFSDAAYWHPGDAPDACFGFMERRALSAHTLQEVLAERLEALMTEGHSLDVWVPYQEARGKTNPLNCNLVGLSGTPSTVRGKPAFKLVTATIPHRQPAYVPQAPGGVVTIIGITEQIWAVLPDEILDVTAEGPIPSDERAAFIGVRYVASGRQMKVFVIGEIEGETVSVEMCGKAFRQLQRAVPARLRRGFATAELLSEEQEEFLWELRKNGLCPTAHLGPPKSMKHLRD